MGFIFVEDVFMKLERILVSADLINLLKIKNVDKVN